MSDAAVKLFVAWDFSDGLAETLLRGCLRLTQLPSGRPCTWTIPGINLGAGGIVGRDLVEPAIQRADAVIALVDRANANVAWEAGLAHGAGTPTHFARVHATTRLPLEGSLSGVFVHPLKRPSDLLALLGAPPLGSIELEPVDPAGPTCVLCPSGIEGEIWRAELERRASAVRLAPAGGYKLQELRSALSGSARALWIVCAHNEPDLPDGESNTSNALLAGVLRARNFPLKILRSRGFRMLADVAGEDLTFSHESFERELDKVLGLGSEVVSPVFGEELPFPIFISDENQLYRWSECLSRLIERRAEIEKLAQAIQLTLNAPGSERGAQDHWVGLLRQAQNRALDLRPMVALALAAAPRDSALKRLAGIG